MIAWMNSMLFLSAHILSVPMIRQVNPVRSPFLSVRIVPSVRGADGPRPSQ